MTKIFSQKQRMGIRQHILNFKLSPSKDSGAMEILRKFPFWAGKGLRAKKLSLVDQMVTLSQVKKADRCTDRQTFYCFIYRKSHRESKLEW